MLSGLVENTGSCLNIRPKRPVVDTEPGVASKPRGCDPWGPGWVGVVGAGCWAKTCGSAIGVLLSYLRPVENRLTSSQRWCHWSITRHEVIADLTTSACATTRGSAAWSNRLGRSRRASTESSVQARHGR